MRPRVPPARLRSRPPAGTTSSEMTFVFLGIVVAVLLIFVLNPDRWRALGQSARDVRDSIRDSGRDDDESS